VASSRLYLRFLCRFPVYIATTLTQNYRPQAISPEGSSISSKIIFALGVAVLPKACLRNCRLIMGNDYILKKQMRKKEKGVR